MLTLIPLTGILSLLLPVTWQALPELTYTIQQSTNLSDWQALPMVISGSDAGESVVLDISGSPVFARLRFSPDGDTNENGLPDQWEWSEFGYLDVDPLADPDLDGQSNLQEFTANTDPEDYFDGEIPILRLTCGREWLVSPGAVSLQTVSLYLQHPSGEPWTHAPVVLFLDRGLGSLQTGTNPDARSLVVHTDSLGRIHQGLDPIHYIAPEIGSQSEVLKISSGRAQADLVIRTLSSIIGGPPRSLVQSSDPDNSMCYDWSGDPAEADGFFLEEQDETGQWIPVIQLASHELPGLEISPGRFSISIELPHP